jgi:catechol 2,3-dioxygenase-like lactoylglutathione lyase family enzyme
MIKSLDHLNIVVDDLPRMTKFFERLGFKEINSGRLTGEWVSSIVGLPDVDAEYIALRHTGSTTSIELIKYYNPTSERAENISTANRIGYRHIAFAVEDIETVVQQLSAEGVQFLSPTKVYPKTGKKLVYFLGPEGLLMELAQYPDAAG